MKHSHVVRSLNKSESDHITLLEFRQSLTCHQIKTAILIATHKKHLHLKRKEDQKDWMIREQLPSLGLI